ncbi:MAG: AAA family ATPase [Defluviitaleaceae bacterium]|nr:AAA family ATPase [Defluviitaleaceae bacterium]MCL2836981.1 AAA family ATPase [Defluviitaleaceae bacterium]
MAAISGILLGTQLVLCVFIVIYFLQNVNTAQSGVKAPRSPEPCKELAAIEPLRKIKLNEPLSEKTRPASPDEIIGQESGMKALQSAVCGPYPQHVIIYGPPGCGKTAAARCILKQAKGFAPGAPFVELDGSILQYDERGIADPLIGSVHDPIYQGAGAFGKSGVPCPRPGAVTKAHGGILFIDEIGELSNPHMSKLLKVLEDRRVNLHSSYYSPFNGSIPGYVHDIFKNGFPADFRLIGATTRRPEDLPPALRSRCTEVFFRALNKNDLTQIAQNACDKTGMKSCETVPAQAARHAASGRDAVNIIQSAVSLANLENRKTLTVSDIEWAVSAGGYAEQPELRLGPGGRIGAVNALAGGTGAVVEIESAVTKSICPVNGTLTLTGLPEESVKTALTVLRGFCVNPADFDIHINVPGVSAEGPGLGAAVFVSLYSAVTRTQLPNRMVIMGEVTVKGRIAAVKNPDAMLEAAREAGADTALIPRANYNPSRHAAFPGIKIIPIETAEQLLAAVFGIKTDMRLDITPRHVV